VRFAWTLNVLRHDLPTLGAKARWIYWRHIRLYDSEVCHECGRPVMRGIASWWHAPDELWLRVGGQERGILCPACFSERARNEGLLVYYEAVMHDKRKLYDGVVVVETSKRGELLQPLDDDGKWSLCNLGERTVLDVLVVARPTQEREEEADRG
jgi:hypothetical protein